MVIFYSYVKLPEGTHCCLGDSSHIWSNMILSFLVHEKPLMCQQTSMWFDSKSMNLTFWGFSYRSNNDRTIFEPIIVSHFPAFFSGLADADAAQPTATARFLARSEASEWRPNRVAPSSPSWSERWLSKRPRIRTRFLAEKTWDTKFNLYLKFFFFPIGFNRKQTTYHTYHLGLAGWFLRKIRFALGNRCLGKMSGTFCFRKKQRIQGSWRSMAARCTSLGAARRQGGFTSRRQWRQDGMMLRIGDWLG